MLGLLKRISLDSWLAAAAGAATLAILVATLDRPAITWDEGVTLQRESKVREWFGRIRSPGEVPRSVLFRETVLHRFWPFAREEPDGHPPFYALLGNIGWLIGHAWLPPLESHRLGPVLLFSFTAGVMCGFVAHRLGRIAGLTAAATWFFMPRVFAHAHLASYDMPLACLWFLSVVTFWKAREGWGRSPRAGLAWSGVFSVVLAMAAATKFTAWLIPFPLAVHSMLELFSRPRAEGTARPRGWRLVALCSVAWLGPAVSVARGIEELRTLNRSIGLDAARDSAGATRAPIAAQVAGTFRNQSANQPGHWWLAVSPAIWAVTRLRAIRSKWTWLDDEGAPGIWAVAAAFAPAVVYFLNPTWWHAPWREMAVFLWSNLSREHSIPIATMFFGRVYEFSLPWYNTIVWTGITVPTPFLLMAGIGLVAALRSWRSDSWLLLMVLNWSTLLIVRALPNAPGHDSERQLLGSFPFLACLVGAGAHTIWRALATRRGPAFASRSVAAGAGAAVLTGAVGVWQYHPCELSYYNALVGGLPGAWRLQLEPTYYWDSLTPDVLDWLNAHSSPDEGVAFSSYPYSLEYLRRWGKLRPPIRPIEPGPTRWYVLQNRSGILRPHDRWLIEQRTPAYTRSLRGVPLLWVYSYSDYQAAVRETTASVDSDDASTDNAR